MRILLKIFVLVLSLIIISNCAKEKEKYKIEETNGVKHFKNSGEPTGKYRPAVKLLYDIKGPENVPDSVKGFGYIADILTDELDNIYILDRDHANIKKYNRQGEFERYFPEQSGGTGLDQLIKPIQFASLYDTLIVIDNEAKKYVRYLNNGQYINSSLRFMGGGNFLFLNSDGKENLTAFVPEPATIDSINYFTNNLCILDFRFKPKQVIKAISVPYDSSFFFPDILTSYTAKNDIFYVAESIGSQYKIYAINGRGQLKYDIEKEYEKIPYNAYEKTALNDFVTSSGFPSIDSNKVYYKKAINSIEIDKNNKLWIMPSMERTEANQDSFYIDIFDKGIFINRTVLDFVKGDETYKLKGNRLYVISADSKSLRVYDYE